MLDYKLDMLNNIDRFPSGVFQEDKQEVAEGWTSIRLFRKGDLLKKIGQKFQTSSLIQWNLASKLGKTIKKRFIVGTPTLFRVGGGRL